MTNHSSFIKRIAFAFMSMTFTYNAVAYNVNEAIVSAHYNNPGLIAELKNLDAAKMNEYLAVTAFLPRAALKGQRLYNKPSKGIYRGESNSYRTNVIEVSQNLYSGGATFAGLKKAEASVKKAMFAFVSKSSQLCEDVVTSYEALDSAKANLDFSIENEKLALQNLEFAEIRFKYGDTTITDVYSTQANLAEAKSRTESARAELDAANAKLEYLIGAITPIDLEPIFLDESFIPQTLDEVINLAITNNPNVIAAEHGYSEARYNVAATTAQVMPSIDIGASISKSNLKTQPMLSSYPDSAQFAVTATVPINIATPIAIGQSRYAAESAKYSLKDIKERVRAQAISLWGKHNATKAMIKAAQENLEATNKALEATEEEAKIGTKTFNELLIMQNKFYQSKVALRKAEESYKVAIYQIISLIGSADNIDADVINRNYKSDDE